MPNEAFVRTIVGARSSLASARLARLQFRLPIKVSSLREWQTRPLSTRKAVAGQEAEDFHTLRELDQKLRIARQVVDLRGIATRERAHGFDTLPVRDCHEFRLGFAVLA